MKFPPSRDYQPYVNILPIKIDILNLFNCFFFTCWSNALVYISLDNRKRWIRYHQKNCIFNNYFYLDSNFYCECFIDSYLHYRNKYNCSVKNIFFQINLYLTAPFLQSRQTAPLNYSETKTNLLLSKIYINPLSSPVNLTRQYKKNI